MKKLKLNIDNINDDFFEETHLLGITSAVKNYRFCWTLNNAFGYHFRLNPDIEIHIKIMKRDYYFPVYQHIEKHNSLVHYVYHNYHDGKYLLPEFRHMDFLWLMKGDCISEEQIKEIIQQLEKINTVQLVTELKYEHVKNKDNLMFE